MTLKGKVILKEQECTGNYDFSMTEHYMTAGFLDTFGAEAVTIASTAISLLIKTYPDNADYFQTFKYVYSDDEETGFWIIHDLERFTVLLPEEY